MYQTVTNATSRGPCTQHASKFQFSWDKTCHMSNTKSLLRGHFTKQAMPMAWHGRLRLGSSWTSLKVELSRNQTFPDSNTKSLLQSPFTKLLRSYAALWLVGKHNEMECIIRNMCLQDKYTDFQVPTETAALLDAKSQGIYLVQEKKRGQRRDRHKVKEGTKRPAKSKQDVLLSWQWSIPKQNILTPNINKT